MNIVAFNSSPRENKTSKTELILQKFLEGARQAGAATETLYLRHYHIKYCLGCFGCWLENKGKCVQQDDMTGELLDRFLAADLVVLATPLYHFNMNARMKSFIERTLPMMEPFFLNRARSTGPFFREAKAPRLVALSVCAFSEALNFQCLSMNMRLLAGPNLAAEIYRHSSEFLNVAPLRPQVEKVFAAVARAGEELVRQGRVSPATMTAVTQDLAPLETLIDLANRFWGQEIEKVERPEPHGEDDESVDKWV